MNELVKVDFAPAVITFDAKAAHAKLDEQLAIYEGMTPESAAQLDLKEAKACRAGLNAMKRELDDARKAIKREYSAPLKEFEDSVKGLTQRIDGYVTMLGDAIDAKVDAEREEKRLALLREYEEFAPFLAGGENGALLPFDRICKGRWLNKSASFKKCVEEMQEVVEAITADYEALKAQAGNLHCYDEDVAVLFRTLSLQEALSHDAERAEEDARLRELQAQQEEQARQAEKAEPPAPSHDEEPNTSYVYEPDLGDDPYVPGEWGGQEVDATARYVIGFEATSGEFAQIADFVKSHSRSCWYADGEGAERVHAVARKAVC